MSPNLIVIDSLQGIEELVAYLADKDLIAFDTETTGLSKRDTVIGFSVCAEEDKAFYVITHAWNAADSILECIFTPDDVTPVIRALVGKSLIMHNAVFDCMMVESNYKLSLVDSLHTDTMLLAHLLDENRPVGLKPLAARYFGADSAKEQEEMKASIVENGGSITKDCYELYKGDPYLIGKYGAQDTILTFKLFQVLLPQLYEQGLDEFFYGETMPMLRTATYQLNTVGLTVDTARLASLKKTLEAECLEAKDFVMTEIQPYIKDKYPGTNKKNTFNIGASQQLSWLLFGELNLEFGKLTKGGKAVAKQLGLKHYSPAEKRRFIQTCLDGVGDILQPEATVNGKKVRAKKLKEPWGYLACDKDTLKKLAPKYKFIDRLLEYQKKSKLLGTYVEGIQERTQYGVIQPNFLQHGTTSGRYSSRNPNFQNLPRDDKRIKECIVARPGKVFVGADYSQLEPRVFAYFSGDTRLLEAFKGADDFYSVVGMEVYDKTDCAPRKDGSPDAFGIKYKKLRDLSKVIALASVYGATAYQLMKTTGKNVEDTQLDMDNYFERFPGVAKLMLDSHAQAKANGFVTNLFGRPRRIPEAKKIEKMYGKMPHAELPYEARGLLNLAVNHRIQSTGASIVNRAAIRFLSLCDDTGIVAKIVLQVHDSLVVECAEKDGESVSLLLQEAMENTTVLEGIALEAVPKIGKNLAEV